MHFISDTNELWKGLSDIPLALLAGVFAFSFRRGKAARGSASDTGSFGYDVLPKTGGCSAAALFACISAAALGGIALHVLDLDRRFVNYGWTVLYLILYLCLYLFYGQMLRVLTRPGKISQSAGNSSPADISGQKAAYVSRNTEAQPEKKRFVSERITCIFTKRAGIFFAVCYALTLVILYTLEGPDIFIFAGSAVVMAVPLVIIAIKNRPLPKGIGLILLFLLLSVFCQFLRDFIPFIVAGEHLFLCIALIFLYRMMKGC